MGTISKIEWTDSTWNPVTGCTKITAGCANCYAFRMAKRLKAMGNLRYAHGFQVTLHEDLIEAPITWKKPRLIFVNSMSDLFHEEVPEDFISRVFDTMNKTPHHTYQILTKRSKRLVEIAPRLNWTANIWQGVSVENETVIHRIDDLKRVSAQVRFLSLEPLIGPLCQLDLKDIHWVIVGGESGPGARPIEIKWVRDIRDMCIEQSVPFFFKQWGGVQKHITGRTLDGRTWDQYPHAQTIQGISDDDVEAVI
jgi:protein gp37